ncbi:MAG: nuclear transport factor 2 family protein [Marinosulfonomonas sp.]|nr:nuclear transport factor 2 family protein [Marinosulfonomonas sp.]
MQQDEIAKFLELEETVWQALVTGDGAMDARMLEDGFLGVYDTGFSDKDGHVGQLNAGPTVAQFTLMDARLLVLGSGVVLLAYKAQFRRVGHDQHEMMYVSSVWRETAQGWRNIFSQDTAASTGA